jgi:Rrf2 family protein
MSSILKISEAVSLGIHAVAMIAEATEKMSVTHIAENLDASENHLSKVLQRLSKSGIVKSSRGPGGGFTMAKPAGEVRLIDIYVCLDGDFPNEGCLFAHPVCGRSKCLLGNLIQTVNSEVKNYFENTTLEDLKTVKQAEVGI